MNEQYQYIGQHLTPKMAQELISGLLKGETLKRQEIIRKVDEAHKEQGGLPSRAKSQHPAVHALAGMEQLGLVKRPKRGFWSILPAEETSDSKEQSESEEQPKIETLDGFMEWARKFESGKYVFRGIPNAKYGIQASAFRRPEEKKRDFEKFFQINQDLIREARLRGYDGKDGRELKELEILADLQHFGAATCLIDFSHSAQIALWFACDRDHKNPEDSPDGKVFAVSNQPPKFREITPTLLKEDIGYFLKDGEESQLYHWQPRQQNHRIIAQQSIFLFGNYEFAADDVCIIAADSKQVIRSELEKISGITKDRMFPDFEGFAVVRSEEVPYTELTPSEFKQRGFLAYERGDCKDAIADYDIAIGENPNYAEVYYLRGLAKKSLKQEEEALIDFNDAIRLDPDNAEAYYERGRVKLRLQQSEEALIDFNDAIRLDPDNAEVYYNRGGTKYNLERYEEALIDFNDAIRLDPEHVETYYWRGRAKYNLERYEEAIVDFSDKIRRDPEYAQAYYWRGLSKKRAGQNAASVPDFDVSIRLNPTSVYSHYHRGEAKFNLNRSVEAKADLEEALSLAKEGDNDAVMRWILNLIHKIDSAGKS